MKHDDDKAPSGNILHLVRETADGLGQLIVQHVKLAKLELVADLRAMGSSAAVIAVCALVLVVGYTLTMAGVALLIGGNRTMGYSFGGVGLAHVLGAGVGSLVVMRRIRNTRLMAATTSEVSHSAAALISAARDPASESSTSSPAKLEHLRVR